MNKNTLAIGKAFTQHGGINKTRQLCFIRSSKPLQVPFCSLLFARKEINLAFPTAALYIFHSFFFFVHSNVIKIS